MVARRKATLASWAAHERRTEAAARLGRIEATLKQATDYGFPAGMAQAGLQLATVDVPWMLERIKELEESIGGRMEDDAQPRLSA